MTTETQSWDTLKLAYPDLSEIEQDLRSIQNVFTDNHTEDDVGWEEESSSSPARPQFTYCANLTWFVYEALVKGMLAGTPLHPLPGHIKYNAFTIATEILNGLIPKCEEGCLCLPEFALPYSINYLKSLQQDPHSKTPQRPNVFDEMIHDTKREHPEWTKEEVLDSLRMRLNTLQETKIAADPTTSGQILNILWGYREPVITKTIAQNPRCSKRLLRTIAKIAIQDGKWGLVQNPNTPPDILTKLMALDDPDLNIWLLRHPNLPAPQRIALSLQ